MRIAIAGAGITGAYLCRLLDKRRHIVDVFDRSPETSCGIKPCAWGTSRGFTELVEAAGLDPAHYILEKSDHVIIDELRIVADLMTVDKRRLIKDLLKGAEIISGPLDPTRYDRIIDATGVARAYLPPIENDIILRCAQWRVETNTPLGNRIRLGRIGYGWSFPLSTDEYHLGCGSLVADPLTMMAEIGWIRNERRNIQCACTGAVRLTAPHYAQPFVSTLSTGDVWGIGEAIGCVAPLAGDGIVPGMRSVQILMEWWDDPEGYTQAILEEFKWMENERRVVDKLKNGERLTLRDAGVLKQNSRRVGIKVGLNKAVSLLQRLK